MAASELEDTYKKYNNVVEKCDRSYNKAAFACQKLFFETIPHFINGNKSIDDLTKDVKSYYIGTQNFIHCMEIVLFEANAISYDEIVIISILTNRNLTPFSGSKFYPQFIFVIQKLNKN